MKAVVVPVIPTNQYVNTRPQKPTICQYPPETQRPYNHEGQVSRIIHQIDQRCKNIEPKPVDGLGAGIKTIRRLYAQTDDAEVILNLLFDKNAIFL